MGFKEWKARRADPKGVAAQVVAQQAKAAQTGRPSTITIPDCPWKDIPVVYGDDQIPRGTFVALWIDESMQNKIKTQADAVELLCRNMNLMIDDERHPLDIPGYKGIESIFLVRDVPRARGFHKYIGRPKGVLLDHFLRGMDTVDPYLDWLEQEMDLNPDDLWYNAHSSDAEYRMKDYRRMAALEEKLQQLRQAAQEKIV